jgi:hypothetical protein
VAAEPRPQSLARPLGQTPEVEETKMRKLCFSLCTLLLLVGATSAFAASKGSSMISLQFGQGQADVVDIFDPLNEPGTSFETVYITGEGHADQLQFGLEAWYMFSADYAFTGAFAMGTGTEKYVAGNFASGQTAADFKDYDEMSIYKASSKRFRLGIDRVGEIGERFQWFMGPGLEFATGKTTRSVWVQEGEHPGVVTEFDSPSMTRVGFNGRVGGTMMVTPTMGITGRVGHTLGRASVEDEGAKASWFSGTWDAMWGLTFAFGGEQ